MRLYRTGGTALLMTALLLTLDALCFGSANRANAGVWNDWVNGVKELSQLPAEVNELKADYAATADKLEEARGTLEETQSTLDAFRRQNEELIERNRELTATVAALTEAQQTRDANARKMRVMLFTAAGLFAGYFIVLRVIRLVLRR